MLAGKSLGELKAKNPTTMGDDHDGGQKV